MKIAILGASGYIGRHLVERLLTSTDHQIVALAPNADSIDFTHANLIKSNCDVFDANDLTSQLSGCEVVYYLVHMMAQKKYDFAEAELRAANSLREATTAANIGRIIYLGGLGNDADNLSKHLASRHKTGEVLRQGTANVIEFRASMVIGDGSISYDIITNLVHKLPILTLPAWAKTLTQPIGLNDAISYLAATVYLKTTQHEIVEIGGPEQISYEELMRRYAKWKGSRAVFINLPMIPVTIAAWWLNLFTPRRHAKVGRAMVESLANPMVVNSNRAKELFPEIDPLTLEKVFV